jgi:hypothetical protein
LFLENSCSGWYVAARARTSHGRTADQHIERFAGAQLRQIFLNKSVHRRSLIDMRYHGYLPRVVAFAWAVTLILAVLSARACTVFTVIDGESILFCDNEDFSNPRTRVWFVPASVTSTARYGCVYLGFDDGWGQSGCNDKGLAYGWLAGFKEQWQRQPGMETTRGNPCQRMLESCSTIEEALAFLERHWEEPFSYGRLLVADRTGKSVILRAKDGKLHAPIVTRSQGMGHRFGMRGNEATPLLAQISKPTLAEAARLLEFTRQEGVNATKYSVVFDLKTCDIWLYRFPDHTEPVHFHLRRELDKGPHYYDIPQLPQQLRQDLRPLTDEMKMN